MRRARRSRTTCSRTARSRRPRTSSARRSSSAPTSTTRPTATTRASGPARRPSCSTGTRTGTPILDWQLPFAKWFVGGTLNVSHNCLDRHVDAGQRRQGRLPLGGRARRHPQRSATPTCSPRSQKLANVLKGLGVAKGDRVAIYMPMIPELPVALLACARIGAAHSVVFGGFSADSLADRINDAEARCSSPPTAAGAAASPASSSPPSTSRSRTRPRSSTSWSSTASRPRAARPTST